MRRRYVHVRQTVILNSDFQRRFTPRSGFIEFPDACVRRAEIAERVGCVDVLDAEFTCFGIQGTAEVVDCVFVITLP